MARKTKTPIQPTIEDERLLESVVDNEKDYVTIRGRRIGFRDLNRWGLHKISKVMIKEGGDELAVNCKCVAAARLNGYFKIKFFWWVLWRWYAYIRNYADTELAEAIQLIKKKVEIALAVYSLNTTLMIAMRETVMKMNREEAKAILQELSTDKAGKSAKSDRG
ncbi:MAG: hypothetical protein K2N48_02870 [Muribaculaceae bacterium]|nr:hypothetical protein [Muribaculaceae bacterium]